LLASAGSVQAMSYVPMSDEALADQSPGIAVVKVLSVQTGHTSEGVTDYTVEVERALKGDLPATFIIRLPEGLSNTGSFVRMFGLPTFGEGEQMIAFVAPRPDGTYGLVQLTLGAFHAVEREGQVLATRDLSEATAVGGAAAMAADVQPRAFEAFSDWLADRAAGHQAQGGYRVDGPMPGVTAAPYTLLGMGYRWFEFDGGGSVPWFANQGGQPGMTGGGFAEIQQAMAAWNNDPSTPINYIYQGTTTTNDRGPGKNLVYFNDPNNQITGTFSCTSGGILGMGGFGATTLATFKGRTYGRIEYGYVITQDGAGCWFGGHSGKDGAWLFTHELGHTLGIGHSCGDTSSPACVAGTDLDEATMRAVAHGDGRGAVIGTDDRAAIQFVYAPRPQSAYDSFFAVDLRETPYVGDFNGDGKTDLITFARDNPSAFGDVYVSLSLGTSFEAVSTKWHDFFAISTAEQVVIGDYNGDGKDDVGTWLSSTSRQFYVALSQGNGMGTAAVWANSIGTNPSDLLFAGDVNGDGKKDLIAFARTEGKVYVAISNGVAFGAPTVWHSFFAVSTYERPRVADVNGDGRADIVTFASDSPTAFGDVYVAVSNGTQFVNPLSGAPNSSDKWHDFFAIRPTEEVRIGRLDSDARQDFFTFLPMPFGQCYTVLSQGNAMGPSVEWRELVVFADTDKPFVGDVNGDGKADVIVFAQAEGKVYVSLAP
jgi:hypothetical protein